MSSGGSGDKKSNLNSGYFGRSNDAVRPSSNLSSGQAVTDAVHERFSNDYIFCENCKQKIIGDDVAISQHFNKSHTSDSSCIYCRGKVFRYHQISKSDDVPSKEYIYHKCRDWR